MDQFVNGNLPRRKERRSKTRSHRDKENGRNNYVFSNESNGHNLIWSGQQQISSNRPIPANETTFSPYPVHVGYPMEPFQFSLYPPVFPVPSSTPYCPVPPIRKGRKSSNSYLSSNNFESQVPNVTSQKYTSLPPSNCEAFSPKSSDSDSNSKRHYSDPGVGHASSDDSDNSSNQLSNLVFKNLMEEMRDVKEKCRQLSSELLTTKQELRQLQMEGCNKCLVTYQPGSITDAVSEMRIAARSREDAVFTKVESQLRAFAERQNINLNEVTSRLTLFEESLAEIKENKIKNASINTTDLSFVKTDEIDGQKVCQVNQLEAVGGRLEETAAPDAFKMLRDLEEQKSSLEKELQQAVLGRAEAEAHSQKLERHVAILKTKINGLSVESCIDEKLQGRPFIQSSPPFLSSEDQCCKVGGQTENAIVSSSVVPSLPTTTVFTQLHVKPLETAKNGKPNAINPPSIPPRPAVFSPPQRPKTIPPSRPADAPKIITDVSSIQNENVNEKSESTDSIDSSSDGLSTEPSSLTPTITISGPVTDL